MNKRHSKLLRGCPAVIAALSCGPLAVHAQTYIHDGRLDEQTHDRQGPFNYFLTPSDALGFMDAPKAFQLTGDGALNAHWGELTLWAGTPLKRLNSRVRTLDGGCLPVINFGSLVDGIAYRVKTFAAPVGLDPHGNLLGFVRLTATNPGKEPLRAAVGARVYDHEAAWRQPFFDHTKPFWWADRFIDRDKWQPWKLWEDTVVISQTFFDALRPGGYICLGHSESMSRISPIYEICRFPEAIVYQKPLEVR